MALAANALTSVSNVKEYLGITSTTYDTLIEQFINRVSDYMERYCRRNFKKTTFIQKYDGDGTSSLVLRNYPIESIEYVKITKYPTAEFTTLYEADLQVDKVAGKISIAPRIGAVATPIAVQIFAVGHQNIEVKYVAGYTAIPDDLEEICIELVARKFKARGKEAISSEGIGGYSVSYFKVDIPEDIKQALNLFKRNMIFSTEGEDLT